MLVEVSGRAVSRAYRRSGSSSNTATHQHQHQPKHLGVSCLSQVSSESRLSSRSSWSRRNRAALCRKVLGQGLTTDDPSWGSNTSRGDSRVSVWSPSSWPYIRSRSVPRYTHPLLSPDACLPVRGRAPYPLTDRTRPPGGRSKLLSVRLVGTMMELMIGTKLLSVRNLYQYETFIDGTFIGTKLLNFFLSRYIWLLNFYRYNGL